MTFPTPSLRRVSRPDCRTTTGFNPKLATVLADALSEYHGLKGANGSKVLLPPGVETPEDLSDLIGRLSRHLASIPSIEHVDFPKEDEARQRARTKYSAKERAYVSTHASKLLQRGAQLIASPQIRQMAATALAKAPPEFMTAPSSSSGKHHPADEINPGGLALHAYRSAAMAEILARYFKLDATQRDLVIAGALLHDIKKGGTPWTGYAPDHGPQGRKFLDEIWTQESSNEKTVEKLVGNHMAQWNKPKATPAKDLLNLIVSYSDYLASQDTVFVNAH